MWKKEGVWILSESTVTPKLGYEGWDKNWLGFQTDLKELVKVLVF